ncbi:MAG: Bug family tripartite tricarboxylate transporter substrate binding protein [Betaproteobacteria bacterium]
MTFAPVFSALTSVLGSAFALLMAVMAPLAANAQSWPSADTRIVVPYPPGAEPDVLARDVAQRLSAASGKNVIVENRPGANSIIGTEVVAKSAGDGTTLLMVDRLAVVTNPLLYSKLPYDTASQIKPVTDMAGVRLFVVVSPSFPARNWRDFVAYARGNPKKVDVAIAGNGHVNHIGMEMAAQSEGISLNYIPYNGMAPAMNGVLAGDVQAILTGGLSAQRMTQTKPVAVLAVGDTQRAAYLPDVPTIVEAGGKAGSIPSTVFSFFAPGRTPDALVDRINQALVALATPEFKKAYEARGLTMFTSSPMTMAAEMKEDSQRFERVIKSLGIKLD